MGGFYKRLIGTNMSLRKNTGKVSQTSSQLQTILTKVEAVINANQIITPAYSLSRNLIVKNEDEKKDPNYHVGEMNHAEKLSENWKKGQWHLEQFWELYKIHYQLDLRERCQLLNKHPRVQSVKEPRIGDIVQVKDSSPTGTWRIGRIIEMIKIQDRKEWAAKVMMPNKNILQRSIIHLYPLGCNEEQQMNEMPNEINSRVNHTGEELKNDELRTEINQKDKAKHRPKRTAAVELGSKIYGQTLMEEWAPPKQDFWQRWEYRQCARTLIYHKRASTFTNIESIWVRMTQHWSEWRNNLENWWVIILLLIQ